MQLTSLGSLRFGTWQIITKNLDRESAGILGAFAQMHNNDSWHRDMMVKTQITKGTRHYNVLILSGACKIEPQVYKAIHFPRKTEINCTQIMQIAQKSVARAEKNDLNFPPVILENFNDPNFQFRDIKPIDLSKGCPNFQ